MDPVAAHGGGGGRHHFGPPVGSPFHSPFHGSHGHGAGGQFQQQAAPQFQAYELHGHQAQMLANSMGGGGGNSGSSMLAKQELVDESTINSAGSNSAGEQGMGSAEPQIMAASFGNASYERLPLDDEPPQSAAPDLAPLPAPLHQQQQQQQSLAMMNAIQLPGDEDEAGGYGGWASAGAGSSRVGPY